MLSNLHLADNTQITEDRYYKIQVLFEKLNFNFKQYGSFVNHSVDESIIPYYGKHGTKQFIRERPIRFGFQIWCITSSEGYLLHAEPYCGVDTDLPDTGLGQGADLVLGLIKKCEVKAGSTVTFDNLLTSLPLLDELTELGIGAIGTLQNPEDPMILVPMVKICLGWITKLLPVAPTMLPVILSAQLNGGQNQPRNELMYQYRILLRTTTSKCVHI